MARKRKKKPVFLYFMIIFLSAALIAVGGLTVLSMNELSSMQIKVETLTASLDSFSSTLSALSEKASQLENQTNISSGEIMGPMPNTEENNTSSEQEEGIISPNKGDSFTENSDSDMDNLLTQINQLLPQNNGNWAVYVCNLQNGSEGNINAKPMQSASLIKLFVMGTVYERYDSMIDQYGQENIDSLLSSMITVSDNDATNTLVNYLGYGDTVSGMNAINEFCKAHGYANTSMGRLMLQSNENGDNYTSVQDCGRFLKEVYEINNGTAQNATLSHADSMYALLKAQTRQNKIPAQIPDSVGVANKTGELDTVENDAAILYNTAKGIDLVICYMSENLTAVGDAQTTIAEQSRMIYGYYNE